MDISKYFKRVWDFLQEDSFASFAVALGLAFISIKFIFFPGLALLTGTSLPLVIVESCSMHHYENGLVQSFESPVYENHGISFNDSVNWDFQNGFNKGDVIFVVGANNIDIGDVIIFISEGSKNPYPIIHRVIKEGGSYSTKGDNYKTNSRQLSIEKNISEDQIIGKALFRIPAIGWAKLIFFEFRQPSNNRGLCK